MAKKDTCDCNFHPELGHTKHCATLHSEKEEPTPNYMDAMTPKERAEQEKLNKTAILTTTQTPKEEGEEDWEKELGYLLWITKGIETPALGDLFGRLKSFISSILDKVRKEQTLLRERHMKENYELGEDHGNELGIRSERKRILKAIGSMKDNDDLAELRRLIENSD